MVPRDRVLAALARGVPDRIPLVPGWCIVEARLLGMSLDDMVERCGIDAVTLAWPNSPSRESLDRYLEQVATDARMGEHEVVKGYAQWGYRPPGLSGPSSPEENPLARAAATSQVACGLPMADWCEAGEWLSGEIERWHERGLAVVVPLPHIGGLWFEEMQRLRGYEQSLLDLVLNPDLAAFLIGRITEMHAHAAITAARAAADILWLDDDIGMPDRMMISPEVWRRLFKPALASVIGAARAIRRDIAVCYHSDGYFEPVITDLVEVGVDAIHPVQPDVFDRPRLKRDYGSQVAFWGGVGTQTLWAWGSPDDIRAETRCAIADLGPGGFVAAPAYDIEPDVPPANLLAFFDAARAAG